ncbi:MAG: hypothetical protein WBA57_05060 [Elainellaceae cyanobacterium]
MSLSRVSSETAIAGKTIYKRRSSATYILFSDLRNASALTHLAVFLDSAMLVALDWRSH